MAKQKSEVNKSDEIRQAYRANPKAKAKEIQAALHEQGIEVTTGQIYFIKGTMKGGKKKKAKKVAAETATITATPSSNGDPLKTIMMVKGWAAQVGGMKKLIALAQALSE